MDALQIELDSAKQECEATNPWTSATHAMLPAVLAERRKQAAELALYRAGRCCQAKCGAICRSLGVQLERNEKLRAAGMGRSGARALCGVCEWSSAWADIELTRQTLADQGSKVEVWLVVKAVLEEAKSDGDSRK